MRVRFMCAAIFQLSIKADKEALELKLSDNKLKIFSSYISEEFKGIDDYVIFQNSISPHKS